VDQLPLDRFYCEQRHQADDRSNFQWEIAPARRVQHVVVKFVFFVPETDSAATQLVHGGGNGEEVFEELSCDIFVNVIFPREFDRNAHQIQREHSHPTRAIALFKMAAIRERGAAVEYADVIKPEESAFKNIFA